MAGGLINIATFGAQDLFLTGTPQITFFKVVYRRYTNFATESIELPFDDDTGFAKTSHIVFEPNGDLINKVYIKIVLPEINLERTINTKKVQQLKQEYEKAKQDLARIMIFMQANFNSYRAIHDLLEINNITSSKEIFETIKKIFMSYSNIDSIQFFYFNSPINYLPPATFNLKVIADRYYEEKYTLSKTKSVIETAIKNSSIIQKFYEDQLKNKEQELIEESNPNVMFAWVDKLGHAIIDYVDLNIGGERIDREFGDWLNVWYELTHSDFKVEEYDKMIGNVPVLTDFNRERKPEYPLYIPLQFWFNRFDGLALPLIALEYQQVTLELKLKRIRQCAYVENLYGKLLDSVFNNKFRPRISLLVDYVFLDAPERRRFAQSSHEYLIDQVQWLDIDDLDQNQVTVDLDFNNPTRELIWVLQKKAYITNNNGSTKCRWDNYSTTKFNKGLSVDYAMMDFAGQSRVARYAGSYFNYVQPYAHHTHTPSDGINVYSFSLKPEEHQPSGSCNFTRISKATLTIWIDDKMFEYFATDARDNIETEPIPLKTLVNLRVYAPCMNVLRIMGGFGGTAFV